MPAKHKKELYIAKSMHELNLKTHVDTDKSTKVKIYCKSADKMFREADKACMNQDEERAYVLYMKFTSLVQYICKTKEYRAEKEYYDSLGGIKNILTAVEKAEVLQESLLKRYENLKEEEAIKAKLQAEEKVAQETDVVSNGDTVTPETALEADIIHTAEFGQDGGITADQLYRFLQDDSKKLLVMDARSSQHYQASHMQYSQVISVPQEAIKPGTTITQIAKGLSGEARAMWDRRGNVDCIVMLNWNSTARDLTKGSTLACLKDAIYKWDSTVSLKTEPLVLEGGYESWLLRYPMFTTNPHVSGPPTKNDASSTSVNLLNFDYPSLEDDQPKPVSKPTLSTDGGPEVKPPLADVQNGQTAAASKPVHAESNAAVSTVPAVSSVKSIPAVNRSSKPKQLQENSTPQINTQSSSASSKDVNISKGISGKIANSDNFSSTDKASSPSSSSAVSLPSVPSSVSSRVTNTKPLIPNRSLKPSIQDNANLSEHKTVDAETGNTKASGSSNVAKTGNEIDSRDQIQQDRYTDILKPVEEKKTEALEEISKMQAEHHKQEEQARQELERMRQERIRTENKQLRQEKAQMEKQLEEKMRALKHMQEELEAQKRQKEQSEAAPTQGQQQQLKEDLNMKQDAAKNTSAQANHKDSHGQVTPPTKVEDELVPKDAVIRAPEDKEPKSAVKSDVHKSPQTEARKPVQPGGLHQQHIPSSEATTHTSLTSPASTSSSSTNVPPTSATASGLPAGWEKRLHPESNKYYYIDHNTETTHWSPPVIGPGGAASATTATVSATKPVTTQAQQPEAKGAGQSTLSPSTTKTRLKSDSSAAPKSGLKRSFSSPNIAQMVINEQKETPSVPSVNRANKPVQRIPSSSVMQSPQPNKPLPVTRARNLNPVYGNQGRSLTGLRNLGNTCFMNSVVQCLSSTTPLTHYFITDKYIPDINRQNPLGRGGNVAQEFAIVIKALWSGQYRSISPLDLRDTVTKYVPEFRKNIGHHHDSQEFLLFLLDGLHEDLNQVKKREYIKEEDLEKYPDHTAAEISWKFHQLLNQSIIVTLFQGQFKSTVCCLSCGHKSVKFEAFMYLSLPIPSNSRCTLQQCLQKFSTEEKLTGDNAIYCSRCRTNRDSAKIILIWKLPRILLIHLKRFYYEGMWRQKLQTMVDFPVRDMDMSPYTRGPKPGKLYQLYAVSNHIGTLDGGHYTASCLNVNNKRWYKFDDHEVHEASPSNIKSAAAYILFYSSVDQFLP